VPDMINTKEVPLPEGLINKLRSYNERQIRRRAYVFVNGEYLHPDSCYTINIEKLCFTHLPLEEKDVLTVAVPQDDERWYYTISGGWCRM